MIMFKVKHISSGLYWKGGGVPTYRSYGLKKDEGNYLYIKVLDLKFSKYGKTWATIGHVHSALNPLKSDRYMKDILKDCIIEQFELNLIDTFNI